MNKLYLVRHAQPIIDRTKPPHEWQLDPRGAARLAAMAALPHWKEVSRVACSTEPKAIRTAEAIRQAHDLPPLALFDELRELHKAGFVQDHDATMARVFARPDEPAEPGWETARAALARFGGCVERLVREANGEDLMVVGHGTVFSLYLAALEGRPTVDMAGWAAIGFPDYAVVDTAAMRLVQPFGAWAA